MSSFSCAAIGYTGETAVSAARHNSGASFSCAAIGYTGETQPARARLCLASFSCAAIGYTGETGDNDLVGAALKFQLRGDWLYW